MAKKVRVVLDDETYRLLEELAQSREASKSLVVREALRYFAGREHMERALDAILARRDSQETMEAGLAAWSRGHIIPHERVVREVRRIKRPR